PRTSLRADARRASSPTPPPPHPPTTRAGATATGNRGGRSMLFRSQVTAKPVPDRHGEPFGKVRDLIVALGEQYPPVTGLVVRVASGREIFLPWSDVECLVNSKDLIIALSFCS